MKNQLRILAILLFAASIAGCSNGNKNSNSEIEDNESNVIDDQVKEQELHKESKLFNDLLSLTQNLNQFEGNAFVGSLDGPCYMVLTSNSQGDNIAKLRYQINNYYQGKADKVDETYTITELKRKSAKIDGLSLNNTRDYEDIYLYGSAEGFKASINDGAITDGSGSGNIWFVLDSVDYELTYVMASSANWSFQGSIKLEVEQYIKLKEIFIDKKLSGNEVKAISKSQDDQTNNHELSQVNQTNNLETNKTLLPQSIDYDGMPALEYTINNEIIALDSYDENDSEGSYIRMKLNDKEVILKMQKQHSSKARRVYSNSDYVVTFDGIIYGKCAGEGAQYLTGKLLIQTSSDQNTITFKGYDMLYSSKECQEMGNG